MSDIKPIHDQNARFAIEGAIEYGRNGVNPPPDDHWLAPFWHMGKQLTELAALHTKLESTDTIARRAESRAAQLESERDELRTNLEEAERKLAEANEQVKALAKAYVAERDALLKARAEGMEEAANWFEKELFDRKWNGVVGDGSAYSWQLRGDWRHVVAAWKGSTLMDAIRAKMKEQK